MTPARRSRARRWCAAVATVGLAFGAGACSDDGDPDAATDPTGAASTGSTIETATSAPFQTGAELAAGGAATYTVMVDNPALVEFPATYEYFFPDELTVHPGSTIRFEMPWSSGEPHNVALGTVVDGAREAIDALPPQEITISPGFPLPVAPQLQAKFAKMPQALPPDQATTADTMRLLQPCYVETGDPPLGEPCGEDQRTPTRPFDGTQSYVSSQVMVADGDRFDVELDPSIEPGRYTFICTLHPSFMYGSLDVVPEDQPADSPDDVTARGQAAVDELNDRYRPVADRLAGQTSSPVDAGALGEEGKRPEITINVFPTEIAATVDEPVEWNIVGAHMITFDPPPDQSEFRVLEEVDGVVQPVAWQPDSPGPGQPGMPAFVDIAQAMSNGSDLLVEGGTVRPDEYLHSGLLFGSLGPLPKTLYRLQFGEPGVYTYYCLRHPGMAGSVTVDP